MNPYLEFMLNIISMRRLRRTQCSFVRAYLLVLVLKLHCLNSRFFQLISFNQECGEVIVLLFPFGENVSEIFLLACHGPWQFGVSSIIESDPGHDGGQKWKGSSGFLWIRSRFEKKRTFLPKLNYIGPHISIQKLPTGLLLP